MVLRRCEADRIFSCWKWIAFMNPQRVAAAKAAIGLALDVGLDGVSLMEWKPIHFALDAMTTWGAVDKGAFLEDFDRTTFLSEVSPPPGVFSCAAPALLVGLLDAVREQEAMARYQEIKLTASELVAKAQKYSEEELVPTRGLFQLKVLCEPHEGWLKKLQKSNEEAFALTMRGMQVARALRVKFVQPPPLPPPVPVLAQAADSPGGGNEIPQQHVLALEAGGMEQGEEAQRAQGEQGQGEETEDDDLAAPWPVLAEGNVAYSNDTGEDGVILFIDAHEMGGKNHRLKEVFDQSARYGLTVKTRPLKSGDYLWIHRRKGREYVFPVLLERKRADDLANALTTPRFNSQKRKMLYLRKKLDFRLLYVFEEDPRKFIVRGCICGDECRGVGRCGNPTVEDLDQAIDETQIQNFKVIKTKDIAHTVQCLVGITTALKVDSEKKSCTLELAQFEDFIPSKVTPEMLQEALGPGVGLNVLETQAIANRQNPVLYFPRAENTRVSEAVPHALRPNQAHDGWGAEVTSLVSFSSTADSSRPQTVSSSGSSVEVISVPASSAFSVAAMTKHPRPSADDGDPGPSSKRGRLEEEDEEDAEVRPQGVQDTWEALDQWCNSQPDSGDGETQTPKDVPPLSPSQRTIPRQDSIIIISSQSSVESPEPDALSQAETQYDDIPSFGLFGRNGDEADDEDTQIEDTFSHGVRANSSGGDAPADAATEGEETQEDDFHQMADLSNLQRRLASNDVPVDDELPVPPSIRRLAAVKGKRVMRQGDDSSQERLTDPRAVVTLSSSSSLSSQSQDSQGNPKISWGTSVRQFLNVEIEEPLDPPS